MRQFASSSFSSMLHTIHLQGSVPPGQHCIGQGWTSSTGHAEKSERCQVKYVPGHPLGSHRGGHSAILDTHTGSRFLFPG